MNGAKSKQHLVVPPRLNPTRPTRLPLSRRTFLGWVGLLTASLGLSGVGASGSQRDGESAHREASRSTTDADGGTVGLGCVGVFVQDLRASLNFYRRLGLAIPESAGGSFDYRLRLPSGQVFFWETYEAVRAFDPAWRPATGSRRVVLEFGFATPGALDAKYAELTAAGHEGRLEPFTFTGSTVRYALINDPDGNEIGLRYPLC